MSKTLCVASSALFLMTMHAAAHHAFAAEYDENKRVTVPGTVTKFRRIRTRGCMSMERMKAARSAAGGMRVRARC